MITFAYLLYLIFQGKRLSDTYWQQVNSNYNLAKIARHDFLTGLPNRLGMQEILSSAVMDARNGGRLVALLYIDLDGFKEVNDRFSHRAGDLLLREVAKRLGHGVEPAGIAARLGGDEFAILISNCPSAEQGSMIAEHVLRATREPVLIEDQFVSCSASIGVSFFPRDADSPDHLVRTADKAMYIAKNSGKNRVCLFAELQPASV